MPLTQNEFEILSSMAKEEKVKTASSLLALVNKHFVGTELNRAQSGTRIALKAGVSKIDRKETIPSNSLRKKEKEQGYKVRTEAESQLGDDVLKSRKRR